MVRPPATLTTWPVMNAASSEARKVTMPDVGRLADALHRDGAHQRVVDLAPGLALAEEAAQDRRVGERRRERRLDQHPRVADGRQHMPHDAGVPCACSGRCPGRLCEQIGRSGERPSGQA